MPSLKEIRREMYRRHPGALGRTESIASLTTTTAVVNALATGVIDSEKFVRKWMLRAEAASAADRVRIVKTFASASGTFTHEGTNYADTTATSEKLDTIRTRSAALAASARSIHFRTNFSESITPVASAFTTAVVVVSDAMLSVRPSAPGWRRYISRRISLSETIYPTPVVGGTICPCRHSLIWLANALVV